MPTPYEKLHKALIGAADGGEGNRLDFNDFQKDVIQLVNDAREQFRSEPALLNLQAQVTICGDVHGQFYDLLRILNVGESPGTTPEGNKFLFLGDYVDRGKQSLETICLLLIKKLEHKQNFFLLRGNHECASINKVYGFYQECRERFNNNGMKVWRTFVDCFNVMPIAAVVENKIFCVHGGLSPELINFEQIHAILRPTDVPETGLLCDLLWSDPNGLIKGWDNNERGVSYTFGKDVVEAFCKDFNIELICRGHQVVEDGYEFFADKKLLTLFSAPNYGGEFDNSASLLVVDTNLVCTLRKLQPQNDRKTHRTRASSPRPMHEKRPNMKKSFN